MKLRNQIVVPLVALQMLGVPAIAICTAQLAARGREEQIIERINGVIDVLGRSNFPATSSVLERMHRLSGAQFIVQSDEGRPIATSFTPEFAAAPLPDLTRFETVERAGRLDNSTVITIGEDRYFAIAVKSPRIAKLLILYPETSWSQARWEAAWPPLALGATMLALMAALTGWLAHLISSRILRLQKQVARIAAGDFQEIEPNGPHDEVDDLTRSINRMSVQLREMKAAIALNERTQLISQLAAGLAHQLRNAVTGAKLGVQLHLRRSPTCGADRSLDVVLKQLSVTEEQVRGLLALGRVEPKAWERVEIEALLDEVSALIGPAAEHNGVTIERVLCGEARWIEGDPAGLRAAVLNLALNAIEAVEKGGTVSIRSSAEGREILLEVRDNGCGLDPELAEKLLDPFVTSKPEGVGLGLVVAARVAEDHGGVLDYARRGEWTSFQLRIPMKSSGDQ